MLAISYEWVNLIYSDYFYYDFSLVKEKIKNIGLEMKSMKYQI